MLKAGYKDSFVLALIINASDIAFLIPPSIGMIIYGVISSTSIAELFIAGIGPGLLLLVLFSAYSMIYATVMGVPTEPKASWGERLTSVRMALWPLGFPVIIIGGIYGGIFSPTEAAAACVLYAVILEFIVFRSLKLSDIYRIAKSTGLITAVVFILVGAGAAFSWVISFAQVPQHILAAVGVADMGPKGVLAVISDRLLRRLHVRRSDRRHPDTGPDLRPGGAGCRPRPGTRRHHHHAAGRDRLGHTALRLRHLHRHRDLQTALYRGHPGDLSRSR